MNHTKNYGLPQWELNDLIRMEDFNAMNNSIEAGLSTAMSKAETATASAETARKTAVAAYSPNNKPYVVGGYYGQGADLTIELGFRPSFLIISGAQGTYPSSLSSLGAFDIATAGNVLNHIVIFTDTGFTVKWTSTNEYPKMAERRQYDFIAFR